MTGHPDTDKLKRYRSGDLPPSDMLLVDDHLTRCDQCRAVAIPLVVEAEVLRAVLAGRSDPATRWDDLYGPSDATDGPIESASWWDHHIEFEEQEGFIEGTLAEGAQRRVQRHIAQCDQCAAGVADLRVFHAQMQAKWKGAEDPAHRASIWKSLRLLLPIGVAATLLMVAFNAFHNGKDPEVAVLPPDGKTKRPTVRPIKPTPAKLGTGGVVPHATKPHSGNPPIHHPPSPPLPGKGGSQGHTDPDSLTPSNGGAKGEHARPHGPETGSGVKTQAPKAGPEPINTGPASRPSTGMVASLSSTCSAVLQGMAAIAGSGSGTGAIGKGGSEMKGTRDFGPMQPVSTRIVASDPQFLVRVKDPQGSYEVHFKPGSGPGFVVPVSPIAASGSIVEFQLSRYGQRLRPGVAYEWWIESPATNERSGGATFRVLSTVEAKALDADLGRIAQRYGDTPNARIARAQAFSKRRMYDAFAEELKNPKLARLPGAAKVLANFTRKRDSIIASSRQN